MSEISKKEAVAYKIREQEAYERGRYEALDYIYEFIQCHKDRSPVDVEDVEKEVLYLLTEKARKQTEDLFERWSNGQTKPVF